MEFQTCWTLERNSIFFSSLCVSASELRVETNAEENRSRISGIFFIFRVTLSKHKHTQTNISIEVSLRNFHFNWNRRENEELHTSSLDWVSKKGHEKCQGSQVGDGFSPRAFICVCYLWWNNWPNWQILRLSQVPALMCQITFLPTQIHSVMKSSTEDVSCLSLLPLLDATGRSSFRWPYANHCLETLLRVKRFQPFFLVNIPFHSRLAESA